MGRLSFEGEGMEERMTSQHQPADPPPAGWGRTLALVVILSVFWLLLSGRTTLPFFLFMAASVAIVLVLNPERPFGGSGRPVTDISRGGGLSGRLGYTWYLGRYIVWLIWKVIKANIEVAILILHPKLPIRPRLLAFRTTLKHPVAKALVANSITLTPGTVTVDLRGDRYLVHALVPGSADGVTKGELQNVVAPIFGEAPDPVPEVRWASSWKELRG
jgi:multicomponent Na+:H+ antiporter subunit E